MQTHELPLNNIHPGHDAEPPINVRRVGRDDGLAELAASISAHGLIQSLAVRQIDNRWYVADGNRRLAALQLLAKENELQPDALIKCEECEPDQDAEEISLAANIMRAPLHEADQYETFRDLAERGLGQDEIAARFGIEAARVRKIMAIGSLSPVILKAWRDGKFDRDPIGAVRAFTLASTLKDQVRVFKKLNKDGQLYSHIIRQEFGAGDREASKFVKFVGKDQYTAAGGTIVEDLFEEDHAISDGALAARLAHEKLIAKRDELIADGWSWAAVEDDMPNNWRWDFKKVEAAKKKASKATKEKSGCVVRLDFDGKLDVTYGVVRPSKGKSAKPGASDTGTIDTSAPATISKSLHERLSVQATAATTAALQGEHRVGLVALLAGFIARWSGTPVKVRLDGMATDSPSGQSELFSTALERLQGSTDDELFEIAAGIAAQALDLRSYNTLNPIFDENDDALAAAIDAGAMLTALRQAFDAEDYFKSAPKAITLQAIREAINDDEARNAGKLKKVELVKFAVANVPATGWLPAELRPSTYDGPGASSDPK